MADRIGILTEGRLVQIGTPREIYSNPANIHVAARLGQPHINLFPANLLPDSKIPAGTRTIGARTEHLDITLGGDVNAHVDWVEHLGDQNHLHIRLGDCKLTTLANPRLPVKPGDPIGLALRNPLYFGADGNRVL
jgi:multiple sugar transport system ATP-binding protein